MDRLFFIFLMFFLFPNLGWMGFFFCRCTRHISLYYVSIVQTDLPETEEGQHCLQIIYPGNICEWAQWFISQDLNTSWRMRPSMQSPRLNE